MSLKDFIIPPWVKPVAICVVAFAIYISVRVWLHDRDERIALEAKSQQQTQTAQAAVDISEDGSQAQAEVQQVEVIVKTERANVERQQEQMRNRNPTVNAWANGRIPDELRNADRAARLARQRRSSGQDASEDVAKEKTD